MKQIPPALASPSFTVSDAKSHGLGRGALRRFDVPHRGLRAHPDAARHEPFERERTYAPRLAPWQFFSHETALALLGVPTPWNATVHVATHRPQREPRIAGIAGHRLQSREPACVSGLYDLRVEDPVRAWRQCARIWPFDYLVAAADHLIHPRLGGLTAVDLADEVDMMGDYRRRLRAAIGEARVGAESVRETFLRLRIVQAGLPEPVLGFDVFDSAGTFIARLDQAYPRFRLGIEYDGRQHAFDVAQFERDARRWRDLERAGWRVIRILSGDLRGDGHRAIRFVGDALVDAGWRLGALIE